MKLITPHVPLGVPFEEGLAILESVGEVFVQEVKGTDSYRVETPAFDMSIYPGNGRVASVWFNDPVGRESEEGMAAKVEAYLARYAPLENWELRMENAWMRYWFCDSAGLVMVYGIDADVLRFNGTVGDHE